MADSPSHSSDKYTQRRKEKEKETLDRKKNFGAEGQLFLFFSSPRHGTATASQKRKQQADSQRARRTNNKAIKWEEWPPF